MTEKPEWREGKRPKGKLCVQARYTYHTNLVILPLLLVEDRMRNKKRRGKNAKEKRTSGGGGGRMGRRLTDWL